MIPTRDRIDLTDWALNQIEQRRTALEKTAERDAEHRGAIAAFRMLIEHIAPPNIDTTTTIAPPDDYGFGSAISPGGSYLT